MSEFNLKNFRENYLKLTQAELAELIGVRQDRISRLEQNLDSISLEELVILSKKTGKSLDEITNYKKNVINKLEVKDSWSKVRYIKNTVINYIKDYSPKNNLNYENKIEPEKNFNKTFSGEATFSSDLDINAIESSQVRIVNERIINQIFNEIVANW